jgi:hypothetical protein
MILSFFKSPQGRIKARRAELDIVNVHLVVVHVRALGVALRLTARLVLCLLLLVLVLFRFLLLKHEALVCSLFGTVCRRKHPVWQLALLHKFLRILPGQHGHDVVGLVVELAHTKNHNAPRRKHVLDITLAQQAAQDSASLCLVGQCHRQLTIAAVLVDKSERRAVHVQLWIDKLVHKFLANLLTVLRQTVLLCSNFLSWHLDVSCFLFLEWVLTKLNE